MDSQKWESIFYAPQRGAVNWNLKLAYACFKFQIAK